MKTHILHAARLVALPVLLLSVSPAFGAPIGTAFSYQAVLAETDGVVDGIRDLRVTLYDSEVGGTVVGGPLTFDDVVVASGRVTIDLDFGAVFDGNPLWLAFEIRDGGATGSFTRLRPRQKIRAVPFAAHAAHADSALLADAVPMASEADRLDGQLGTFYLDWGNLSGAPPEADDGDDDLLASLSCNPGGIPVWGASGWECGPEAGPEYQSITVVGPVGDAAANGTALLAAMDSITTPAGADEAHLLLIEPGAYDLGDAMLEGKPWVDIAGAGRNVTGLTSSVCDPDTAFDAGTVLMAGDEELRDLKVTNTCDTDNSYAVTIPVDADRTRVTRVEAIAAAGPAAFRAVAVNNGGYLSNLTSVSAQASGATSGNLAIVMAGERGRLSDCVGVASGGAYAAGGWIGGPAAPSESTTFVSRCSFQASAASTAVGLTLNRASMVLDRSSATGDPAVQVSNDDGDNTAKISQFVGTGQVEVFVTTGSVFVLVDQSRIVASGSTIHVSGSAFTVRVAATQLWGAAVSGSVTCAGVWDENWVFYTNTCP